jgi:L-alanine-DL-glutamate epimerase-like enolase superfamily enzyme
MALWDIAGKAAGVPVYKRASRSSKRASASTARWPARYPISSTVIHRRRPARMVHGTGAC